MELLYFYKDLNLKKDNSSKKEDMDVNEHERISNNKFRNK